MTITKLNNKKQQIDDVIPTASIEDPSILYNRSHALSHAQLELLIERIVDVRRPVNSLPSGLGNPGPLGLGAFALTTFMLSVFNAGSNLIDHNLESVVLPVALFYGGIAQIAAGMWEYQINNTFGATTFISYGGFWMSFAAYMYLIVPNIESIHKTQQATGLFLLAWFIFTLYINVAAWRVSKAVFAVITTLNLTFLFLIIGNLGNVSVITNIGGWLGIITAILAWYASCSVAINTTFGRSILPIGTYIPNEKKFSTISFDL